MNSMQMAMQTLVLLATIVAVCASSMAPTPSDDGCSTMIYDMSPCVDYVRFGSKQKKPTKECCSGFKVTFKTHANCVCVAAIQESRSMAITLNLTRAVSLPSACGVSTPPPVFQLPISPIPSPATPVNSPTPVGAPSDDAVKKAPALAPAPAASDDAVKKAPAPAASQAATLAVSSKLGAVALVGVLVFLL